MRRRVACRSDNQRSGVFYRGGYQKLAENGTGALRWSSLSCSSGHVHPSQCPSQSVHCREGLSNGAGF